MTPQITYLDNNASTRVDPRVVKIMAPLFDEYYGHPSSLHRFGATTAGMIEQARESVAELIGARPDDVIFTSGGTEADNAALRGVLAARPDRRRVVVSAVEHHAVLDTCEALEHDGVEVTRIGVDGDGILRMDELAAAIRPDTALVCAMLANNETGVIFPLAEISRIAHERGALVFSDAVNALGKISVNVHELGVDLMALSSHKVYGPKGVGALYVRPKTPFRPLITGGPQERRRRGGTHNAPGIVGFGAACRLVLGEDGTAAGKIRSIRDRLEHELNSLFDGVRILGAGAPRLPNTTCAAFPGRAAEPILLMLSEAGICASSGAACSSGAIEPSHVLKAMGVPREVAEGQIRFSLGRFSTADDIHRLLKILPGVLKKAQNLAG